MNVVLIVIFFSKNAGDLRTKITRDPAPIHSVERSNTDSLAKWDCKIPRTRGGRRLMVADTHPMIEKYQLSRVTEGYGQMHSSKVLFRVVLTMDR